MLDRLKYQIRNPDHVIEELILSGMITQTDFLKQILPRFNLDFFESEDARIIVRWVIDYYKHNNEAPGPKIKVICRVETRKDETLQKERLETFLATLLEQQGDSFNTEYVLNKAFKFFRKRSLIIALENTQHFINKDDLEEAELSYYKYKEVAQGIVKNPNPLGSEALRAWWEYTDEELMKFSGYLGEYLSPICRGQLIGVLGPPKRGKTTFLTEFACVGLMHKLKVAFFSLEMSIHKINQRIDTRLAGRPKITEDYQNIRLPLIDCVHNQTGNCRLIWRIHKGDLIGQDDKIVAYDSSYDATHKVCSACIGRKDSKFRFAPWYETRKYSKTSLRDFEKIKKEFREIFGENNLVVEAYPVGSFSCQDLKNRLDLLEQERNFVPDIVIVDYADIMKRKHERERRHEIGGIWEQLVALSQERNCLGVSASQTNRAAANKPDLSMEDLAEDFSKAMISDIWLAVNQTSQEKDQQVARIAVILHRHRGFSFHHQCRILQALEIGQFCLDSCEVYRKLGEKRS